MFKVWVERKETRAPLPTFLLFAVDFLLVGIVPGMLLLVMIVSLVQVFGIVNHRVTLRKMVRFYLFLLVPNFDFKCD